MVPDERSALIERRWDVAAASVVALTALAHLVYLVRDGRAPHNRGLYYEQLPLHYFGMSDGPFYWQGLIESTGWYNFVIALALHVFGRKPDVMAAFGVLWVSLLIIAVALIARRLAGSRGAFLAALLVSAIPDVVIMGRTTFIHVPETALVLWALLVWMRDRSLSRWSSILGMSVLGVLTIALRQSGLIWIGTLVPMLLFTGGEPRRWRRIGAVIVAWGLALLIPLQGISTYLGAKVNAHDRYLDTVASIQAQLTSGIGTIPLAVGLLGLVAGLGLGIGPVRALLWTWVVLPFVLWLLFRAGIDNFLVLAPALVLLAAVAMRYRGWFSRVLLGVSVVAFLSLWAPQFFSSTHFALLSRVMGVHAIGQPAHFRGSYRPWKGYGANELDGLLDAFCPPPARCNLVTDQGVGLPYGESSGDLEVFLLGGDNIHLGSVTRQAGRWTRIDAFVQTRCEPYDRPWRQRYPGSEQTDIAIRRAFNFKVGWWMQLQRDCRVMWFAPRGRVPDPDALPDTGEQGAPPTNNSPQGQVRQMGQQGQMGQPGQMRQQQGQMGQPGQMRQQQGQMGQPGQVRQQQGQMGQPGQMRQQQGQMGQPGQMQQPARQAPGGGSAPRR